VITEIRNILYSSLSPAKYYLFRRLIAFLNKVAAHSDKNLMPKNNLLIVVTPTLGCLPALISLTMEHYEDIFGGIEDDPIYSESDLQEPQEKAAMLAEDQD
jgi:hypothetical protein